MLRSICIGTPDRSQNERDVGGDGPMRKEPSVLLHVSDLPPEQDGVESLYVLVAELYYPGVRLDHAVEAAEKRRLAGSALSDQCGERTCCCLECNVIERSDFAVMVRDVRCGEGD